MDIQYNKKKTKTERKTIVLLYKITLHRCHSILLNVNFIITFYKIKLYIENLNKFNQLVLLHRKV